MGYYSVTSNEIRFSPPLSSQILKDEVISRFIGGSDSAVYLDPDDQTISGPQGDFKAYWFKDGVTELVARLIELYPEITFDGYIEIQGEGDGVGNLDLWRLLVVDGKVEEVQAQIVWPN